LWVFIVLGVGFGLQIVIPMIIVIIIGVIMIVNGSTPEQMQEAINGYTVFLNLIFIVLSFVGIFLILGYLSSIPDKNISTSILPPPPPGFDENSSTEISS
jgi:hypothetical protein